MANLEVIRWFSLVNVSLLYSTVIICQGFAQIVRSPQRAGPAGNRTPEILVDKRDLELLRAQQYNYIMDKPYRKTPFHPRKPVRHLPQHELLREERAIFKRLTTPRKIQDFLVSLPINFEENGDTLFSPRMALQQGKAHCFEGALFAAAALWFHGARPLLLDLKTTDNDESHVVALFKKGSHWGAISHTNHAVLRYREPIYANVRELALSYFHEYFLNKNGAKTLRSYSSPFDLSRVKKGEWVTAEEDIWYIDTLLDKSLHYSILTSAIIRNLRPADPIERKAGEIVEWQMPV